MSTAEEVKKGLDNLPIAACRVNGDGVIVSVNPMMKNVFAYDDIADSNFFALTGAKISDIFDAEKYRIELNRIENGEDTDDEKKDKSDEDDSGKGKKKQKQKRAEEVVIHRNDRSFSLRCDLDAEDEEDVTVYFVDVTEREKVKKDYAERQLCLMYISIDNYDELISSSEEDSRRELPSQVDKIVRHFAEKYNASIQNIDDDSYQMSLYRKDADAIIETKFAILDEVREIETKVDFPVSLSIGLGMDGNSPAELSELATAAQDLAMGRGGDQAVVKMGEQTHYYGGTLQSVEKNNKGKSRVIAHALKNLIRESSKVFIMGHRWPDMDSFGAAVGAYRITKYLDKDAHIVIEEYNEALQEIYEQASKTGDYDIIGRDKALEMCDPDSLVIVVDTTRPGLIECPELVEKANRVVMIDHHRLSEDAITDATLSYVESYASSASELMTEIIQYSANKRIINKFEAEALLAGITVDTNSFSIKTGVRTFEAAAWLRRAGADTTEVKRFFQTDVTTFQAKAEAIANAEYLDYGIAISLSEGFSTEAQIINAQVADSLLSVKGVKAAFAVGMNDRHRTVISGRSLGEINVQVILEKFGGGGHLTSAGAQVDDSPQEVINSLRKIFDDMFKPEDEEEEELTEKPVPEDFDDIQ